MGGDRENIERLLEGIDFSALAEPPQKELPRNYGMVADATVFPGATPGAASSVNDKDGSDIRTDNGIYRFRGDAEGRLVRYE